MSSRFCEAGFAGTILPNARSNASGLSSVSNSCAASRKRLYCSGSSAFRFRDSGAGLLFALVFAFMLRLTSCSIGEPLAYDTTDRTFGALIIINAERGPVVVAEIEFAR